MAFITVGLLVLLAGTILLVLILGSVARRLPTVLGALLLIEEPGLGALELD